MPGNPLYKEGGQLSLTLEVTIRPLGPRDLAIFVLQYANTHHVLLHQLAKHLPKNLLKNVTKVRFQKRDGICSLRAIVLYVGKKQKCMDPNNKALIAWIQKVRPAKYY